MKRDPKQFRERFQRWKNGELVYDAGLPKYEMGKDDEDVPALQIGTVEDAQPQLIKDLKPVANGVLDVVPFLGSVRDLLQYHETGDPLRFIEAGIGAVGDLLGYSAIRDFRKARDLVKHARNVKSTVVLYGSPQNMMLNANTFLKSAKDQYLNATRKASAALAGSFLEMYYNVGDWLGIRDRKLNPPKTK